LKKHSEEKCLQCDNEVKAKVHEWMQTLSPDFFSTGTEQLVYCWDKYLNLTSDYVDK
jgi:hypothetical protein